MADVVNMRNVRKQKQRAEKEEHAALNRARFGRGKAEKKNEKAQKALDGKRLEGHKIDR
jgi:Domain of unknown function (DUF4169)